MTGEVDEGFGHFSFCEKRLSMESFWGDSFTVHFAK